jgi:hypothetical protein
MAKGENKKIILKINKQMKNKQTENKIYILFH